MWIRNVKPGDLDPVNTAPFLKCSPFPQKRLQKYWELCLTRAVSYRNDISGLTTRKTNTYLHVFLTFAKAYICPGIYRQYWTNSCHQSVWKQQHPGFVCFSTEHRTPWSRCVPVRTQNIVKSVCSGTQHCEVGMFQHRTPWSQCLPVQNTVESVCFGTEHCKVSVL